MTEPLTPASLAEMYHPDSFFVDPGYAELDLHRLVSEFDLWLRGRSKPIKPRSREKYHWSLLSLLRSLAQHGVELQLRNLHPSNVDQWVADCRAAGQSEDGIASTLSSVKVFANSYVFKHLELAIGDPLRKVPRITPPEREMQVLDQSELEQILASLSGSDYETVRNRAFVAVLMSTGLRLRELRECITADYDPVYGDLSVLGKGDRPRTVRLSPRSHRYLKDYLKLRPKRISNALWLTRAGTDMTEWAWRSFFRRLKRRSGVPRVHAHLFRHTFGSSAIDKGAERAAVQDMMGHQTDLMTRRYTREARRRTAAAMMPQYSPV